MILQGLQNAATEKEREQFVRAVGNLGPQAAGAAPLLTTRLQKAQAMETLKKGVLPHVAMAKPKQRSVYILASWLK